jgi:hypothetical protein
MGERTWYQSVQPIDLSAHPVPPILVYSYANSCDTREILEDVVTTTAKWYRAWIASCIRAGEASCKLRNRLVESGFPAVPPTLAAIYESWFEPSNSSRILLPADLAHFMALGDATHTPKDDADIKARWLANCVWVADPQPSGAYRRPKRRMSV